MYMNYTALVAQYGDTQYINILPICNIYISWNMYLMTLYNLHIQGEYHDRKYRALLDSFPYSVRQNIQTMDY